MLKIKGSFIFAISALLAGDAASASSLRGLNAEYEIGYVDNFEETMGSCNGAICGMWGDPHMITCDGLAYDCQGEGLFTLMKNHLFHVQGHFISVGTEEMKKVIGWEKYPVASSPNDIIIDILSTNDTAPTLQFSFPDFSVQDGLIPSEEGCLVGFHYTPWNMPGHGRSSEPTLQACRERCESIELCTQFSYWADGGCHPQDIDSLYTETPKSWSRSVAGPVHKCGIELARTENTTEYPFARYFGNGEGTDSGKDVCPFWFYLDGVLQDISNVPDDGFLYGELSSGNYVKLEGLNKIRISHRTESGETSESLLETAGDGPGELFSCHWAFWVCLPSDEQEQFAEYSVGLFGSPDGNQTNDWTNVEGETLEINDVVGSGAFDYCQNWCVSQEDSLMIYPEGTTYEDHMCIEQEYQEFSVYDENCVISANKILEKCAGMSPVFIHSCQVECCFGGCNSIDNVIDEIVELIGPPDDPNDIIYSSPPTLAPTLVPTAVPTIAPTLPPTSSPSIPPTTIPTSSPSLPPTAIPTNAPTLPPTSPPSLPPTAIPTNTLTLSPTSPPGSPTATPTIAPTLLPTSSPSLPPTTIPTSSPSLPPTLPPSLPPTAIPTIAPTLPPTSPPSLPPTAIPTNAPTLPPTLPIPNVIAPTLSPGTTQPSMPVQQPQGLCDDTGYMAATGERYMAATGDSVCPASDKGIVSLVRKSHDRLPCDLIYGIELEDVKDEDVNLGRSVKFRVYNAFADEADIFVRYQEKTGRYANEARCESMPSTKSGCDPDAPEIEAACIEFPGVTPFALVDIYFVSRKPNSFIKLYAKPDTAVHTCCQPPDEYDGGDYGVVKYTYEIQCACQSSSTPPI